MTKHSTQVGVWNVLLDCLRARRIPPLPSLIGPRLSLDQHYHGNHNILSDITGQILLDKRVFDA